MSMAHHPADEDLMSCSAGSMPEALAAVMASHISLCERCRKKLAFMELIGASLLEDMPPSPLARNFGRVPPAEARDMSTLLPGDVPLPLRKHVGPSLRNVPWRWVAPGIWQHRLPLAGRSKGFLRLIKVSPGLALPDHGHTGSELTLVLQGSFSDAVSTYRVGDIAAADAGDEHGPVAAANGEECICLIASEGQMLFKSFLGRIVQRLTGF
jgi:putative transcriptional regulator